MLDSKLKRNVLISLETELPKKYVYHCEDHTKAVIAFACLFGEWISLSVSDIRLVSTAALLHDFGYIYSYCNNESIAAEYAAKTLPDYGYSQQDVRQIVKMILATQVPCHPETPLEKILCDADLWHLGYPAHFRQACLLRQEKENCGIVCEDDSVWGHAEMEFLSHHHYFTAEVERQLQCSKEENVKKIGKYCQKKHCGISNFTEQ